MLANFGLSGMGFRSIGSGNDHIVIRAPVKMMILSLDLIPVSVVVYGVSSLEELRVF